MNTQLNELARQNLRTVDCVIYERPEKRWMGWNIVRQGKASDIHVNMGALGV